VAVSNACSLGLVALRQTMHPHSGGGVNGDAEYSGGSGQGAHVLCRAHALIGRQKPRLPSAGGHGSDGVPVFPSSAAKRSSDQAVTGHRLWTAGGWRLQARLGDKVLPPPGGAPSSTQHMLATTGAHVN